MKTALLDSSVWISFFGKDIHFKKADKIITNIEDSHYQILLPTIVYIEVLNVLKRIGVAKKTLRKIKTIFLTKRNIKIIHPPKRFWLNHVEKYMDRVKLKSSDLIILAHTLEFKTNKFFSFDKKLKQGYFKAKSHAKN